MWRMLSQHHSQMTWAPTWTICSQAILRMRKSPLMLKHCLGNYWPAIHLMKLKRCKLLSWRRSDSDRSLCPRRGSMRLLLAVQTCSFTVSVQAWCCLLPAAKKARKGRKSKWLQPGLYTGMPVWSFDRRTFTCRPEENIPPAAAQKGRKGGKKKRVQLDVGPDHRPATQLDGQSIRALLKDRAPLLRPRQALAERSLAVQRLHHNRADLVSIPSCFTLHTLTLWWMRPLCVQSVVRHAWVFEALQAWWWSEDTCHDADPTSLCVMYRLCHHGAAVTAIFIWTTAASPRA